MRYRSFSLTLAFLLMAGCAQLDQFKIVDKHADSEAVQLPDMPNVKLDGNWPFHYYRLAAATSRGALNEEYERAKKDIVTNRTALNQWRLALLLSLPNTPFQNNERAAAMFRELSSDPVARDPTLRDIAFVLQTLLNEQSQSDKKVIDLASQNNELVGNNRILQDQLNALKAIERNLNQRGKPEGTNR